MYYQLTYLDLDGRVKKASVNADTEDDAKYMLEGITPDRIQNIVEDKWGDLLRSLMEEKLPLKEQASFLASYCAAIAGGADQSDAMNELASKKKKFSKVMPKIRAATSPSEKLRIMNFDPQVQLLAQVGEKSGRLASVIGEAADDIISRNKLMADIARRLAMPFILAILGIAIMIGLPLYAAPAIKPILEMPGISMDTTFATDLMIWLESAYRTMWFQMILVIGGGIGVAFSLRRALEKFPVFSAFADYARNRRSVTFMMTFPALFQGGVHPEDAIKMLSRASFGQTREIYSKMAKRLSDGESLSNVFEAGSWSGLLIDCMAGVDNIQPVEAEEYFARIRPLSITALEASVNKIVATVSALGIVLAIGSLAMVIVGMMFPVMSATPSMTGR